MNTINLIRPDFYHKHRCPCGNTWIHSDLNIGNILAHTCTECGEETRERVKDEYTVEEIVFDELASSHGEIKDCVRQR